MPTYTSNYHLAKPLVNDPIDEDLWGGELNDNMDIIDSALVSTSNWPTSTKTTTFSVTADDRHALFLVDCALGNVTVNLLAAATAGNGFPLAIKKIDSSSNTVIIDPNGSETIDGSATLVLSQQYDVVVIDTNGSNWFLLARSSSSPALTTRTYYVTGSGNFTVPAGKTRVRTTISGGGGGGHGADGNSGIYAGTGGASSVTYSATTVTANGGLGGIWSTTNLPAAAVATATGGDFNLPGGGSVGGNSGINGNNAVKDGEPGAYAVKDWTVTPGDTMAYSVGAGGTKLTSGVVDATDGVAGYIIFEY